MICMVNGVFLCFLGFVREETMKSGFSGWFCVQGETMIARALRNRERDGKLWYNRHHFYFIASFFFFLLSSFLSFFWLSSHHVLFTVYLWQFRRLVVKNIYFYVSLEQGIGGSIRIEYTPFQVQTKGQRFRMRNASTASQGWCGFVKKRKESCRFRAA